MTEHTSPFSNDFDHRATLRFFQRWKKWLLIVFLLALIGSIVASLMIHPRYKSSVVLFPTSSNRLTKAITADRYSMDFLDYGIEKDCEYTIQILSSQSMENMVCDHFNLMVHYAIPESDPHKMFKLHEMYRGYVNVKRTEYLGVEVSVMDEDPQMACDMANFIADHYDSLCRTIHNDRARDAFRIMDGVCNEVQTEIDSLVKGGGNAELVTMKRQELAELQTLRAQRKVDLNQNASYKFWLDRASVSDKKAYPKRAVIVLLGTFGGLLMSIFVMLLVDICKKEEEAVNA